MGGNASTQRLGEQQRSVSGLHWVVNSHNADDCGDRFEAGYDQAEICGEVMFVVDHAPSLVAVGCSRGNFQCGGGGFNVEGTLRALGP